MIENNQFGDPCVKCGMWVSPFQGITLYGLTLCLKCKDNAIKNLKIHFLEIITKEPK